MKNKTLAGHFAAALTIFIWGTTYISTKILLQDFSPLEILLIRFLLGYVALWIVYPKKLVVTKRKQEWYFAAAGLCGITLYFLFENIALIYTLASNVGILVSISPFISAIFSCIFLKEKWPRFWFYIGFVIAMIGICIISLNGNASFGISPIGNILAILASVIWAGYSTLSKKISTFDYPVVAATRRTFFYGILFMIPCLFFSDFHVSIVEIAKPVNFLNLIFLGLGACALCFVTWNFAVKLLGVVKTSVYLYMVPVITTVTSVIILDEPLSKTLVGGIFLILIGLFLSEVSKKSEKE